MTAFFALLAPALRGWRALGMELSFDRLDDVASGFEGGVVVVHLFVASGRVYGGPAWRRWVASALMVFALLGALYAHRFTIFAVSTWIS